MHKRIFLALAMPFVLGIAAATFGNTVSPINAATCCCGASCPMKKKDASIKEACCCDDCDRCGDKAQQSDDRDHGVALTTGRTCDCCKKKGS